MSVETVLVSTVEGSTIYKCYPLEKPQNVTTPVVVYKRLSTVKERVHTAVSTLNRVRMSLTVYGTSLAAIRTAVDSINTLLDHNTTAFTFAYLVDQKDFKDPGSGLFYTYLEYIIYAHLT